MQLIEIISMFVGFAIFGLITSYGSLKMISSVSKNRMQKEVFRNYFEKLGLKNVKLQDFNGITQEGLSSLVTVLREVNPKQSGGAGVAGLQELMSLGSMFGSGIGTGIQQSVQPKEQPKEDVKTE